MKIQSSTITMSGQSSFVQQFSKVESLKAWVGNKRPDFENQNSKAKKPSPVQLDILKLTEQAKKELETQRKAALAAAKSLNDTQATEGVTEDQVYELSDKDKLKIEMIQRMIESLTGKRLKFILPKDIKIKPPDVKIDLNTKSVSEDAASTHKPNGWGVEYDYHESYYEQAKMSFSSTGVIKTQDGKEINFSLQLNMSREFVSQQHLSIRTGDAKLDPLVINYAGNAPTLTDTKFSFDLDSDGKQEQISFTGLGSGFLALDKNSDGKINDGAELFGPQSGNGFSELAKYDDDQNGWIDENDSIFDKLRIWTKDSKGNDTLFAIGEKGIGAIYLGSIDTDFSLKNQNNDSLGEIQKTGIFVKENGSVGTIQHIDLTI